MGNRGSKSQADWMQELPDDLRNYPLYKLAIPGSHEAGSYSLACCEGVAPDFNLDGANSYIRATVNCCCVTSCCIRRWSKCQMFNFRKQMEAGVRFFDMRVGKKVEKAEADNKVGAQPPADLRSLQDSLRCIHGMYGPTVRTCMTDARAFLDAHPQEVALFDFSRFFRFTDDDHAALGELLDEIFGDLVCRYSDGRSCETLTLSQLCEEGTRVLIFYYDWLRAGKGRPARCRHFWPYSALDSQSSRADTRDPEEWAKKQHELRSERHDEAGKPPSFYVCQAALTPDDDGDMIRQNVCLMLVSCGLAGTLRTECAGLLNPTLLDWMGEDALQYRRRRFVIYTADYVSDAFQDKEGVMINFASRVIELNKQLIP